MRRFAVIPTCCREQDFNDCLSAISPQVDWVVIIDNGAPYLQPGVAFDGARLCPTTSHIAFEFDEKPPSISAMWNFGIDYIKGAMERMALADEVPVGEWFVAILNDDCIVPPDWFERIEEAMETTGAAAGYFSNGELSMTGYAFIIRGSKDFRADETMRWWYSDRDFAFAAEANGGVARVEGMVEHRHPNSTTVGELRAQAVRDGQRFFEKWGRMP